MRKIKWVSAAVLGLCVGIVIGYFHTNNVQTESMDGFVPRDEYSVNRLVDAIYQAEGGKETSYPFGIKSVACEGYVECRQVCVNTVVNNVGRWENAKSNGYSESYLTFLWKRYCPPKAHRLNENWLGNVKWFMNNEG